MKKLILVTVYNRYNYYLTKAQVYLLLTKYNIIQLLIIDQILSKPGATQFSIGSFELVY